MVGLLNFQDRKGMREILKNSMELGLRSDHIKLVVKMGKEKVVGKRMLDIFEEATGLNDDEKSENESIKETKTFGLTADHVKRAAAVGKEEELSERILRLYEEVMGSKELDKAINEFTEEVKTYPKLDVDMAVF